MAAMATTAVEAYASTYVFMHERAVCTGWRKNFILVCFFFGLLTPDLSNVRRRILLVLCQRAWHTHTHQHTSPFTTLNIMFLRRKIYLNILAYNKSLSFAMKMKTREREKSMIACARSHRQSFEWMPRNKMPVEWKPVYCILYCVRNGNQAATEKLKNKRYGRMQESC